MSIQYRTGRKADCARIAQLINIASGGVIEYMFNGLVPNQTSTEIIAHNIKSDHESYSYKNAIVAEDNGKIVGLALSFPAEYHHITDEMRQFSRKKGWRTFNISMPPALKAARFLTPYAWMKAFIDRLYCFYDFDNNCPRRWSSRLAGQNRKAVIAAVCEQETKKKLSFFPDRGRWAKPLCRYSSSNRTFI